MQPTSINKPRLVLVEGGHEISFFECLIRHLEIDDIQVTQVGGEDNFRPNIKNIPKLDGFDELESIGIVRDADHNHQAKFQSVCSALEAAGLPFPETPNVVTNTNPKVNVFIAPDNGSRGSLEDVCLRIIENDPVIECVTQYMDCIGIIQDGPHPHDSKARVQVYLASKPDGDLHMGIASHKGIWNWESPALESIRSFIQSLQ